VTAVSRGTAVIALAWALACDSGTSETALRSAPPEAGATLSGPIRRPSERFVMSRVEERCEILVYREDEAVERLPEDWACPKDLEPGERIRLTGAVCVREGAATPERNVPVVCPNPLTNAERDRRRAAVSASAVVQPGGPHPPR
jgi:hypothetical protein